MTTSYGGIIVPIFHSLAATKNQACHVSHHENSPIILPFLTMTAQLCTLCVPTSCCGCTKHCLSRNIAFSPVTNFSLNSSVLFNFMDFGSDGSRSVRSSAFRAFFLFSQSSRVFDCLFIVTPFIPTCIVCSSINLTIASVLRLTLRNFLVNPKIFPYTSYEITNMNHMSNVGKPAYKDRPDPQRLPNRVMLVAVVLLLLGFIQATIKNHWLDPIITFIKS